MTSLNNSGSNLESTSSLNASSVAAAIKTNSPGNDNNNNSNSNISSSRAAKIKKLKAKLINEEHRLVLMKKIRQSQTRPINQQQQQLQQQQQQQQQQQPQQQQPQQAAHQQANSNPTNQPPNNTNIQLISNNCQTANPAKKLRPSQSLNNSNNNNNIINHNNLLNASGNLLLNKNLLNNNINNIANLPPGTSSMNQTPAHAHQRTKSNTLWNQPPQIRQPTPAGLAPPHVGNLSRNPITTPPNVVQAMMGGLNANQQSLLMNQINALTAAAANSAGASGLLGTPGGSANRRSGASNLLRQPITTPPNVIQDVRGGATLTPSTVAGGGQHVSNRRAHSGNFTTSRQQPQQHHHQQPLVTAPNVLQDIRGALSGQQQSLLMNANNILTPPSRAAGASGGVGSIGRSQQSSLSITPQQQQSPFNKAQAAQILLQRRTAAKQAVQKQLEQTLMQLPQKHIQLGIDFIPNANNIEFVCYIGLEACVDYLTQSKNPLDTQPLEKPFQCSTCGTDFTPSWSWKRSNPVCENCVSNHVKKSIKNSQANRIKSVLAKAVKQEQEIDQKIMTEAANVVTSPSTPTTSSGQASSNNQRHSSLLQPASHSSTPRSSSSSQQQQHRQQQQQQQSTPNWSRISQSPSAIANRSTASMSSSTSTTPTTNVLPNINLNNPLAALSSLQPAALASLLEMSPQFSTLASLMAGNAAAAAAPPPPPPPPAPVNTAANSNQIAQVAALLMNQLTANLWNKR